MKKYFVYTFKLHFVLFLCLCLFVPLSVCLSVLCLSQTFLIHLFLFSFSHSLLQIFHATNDTEGKLSNGELIGRATGLVAGVFIFYLLEIVLHTLVIAATKKSSINNNQSSNNFPDEDPLVIGQEEGIEAFFKVYSHKNK